MKRVALVLMLAALASPAAAATLTVRGTAPVNDNLGTCSAPQLGTRSGATVMHFEWSGAVNGEDSVSTAAGVQVTFSRNGIPAGTYNIRGWASDGGGAGCDTTIVRRFGGPPWKPTLGTIYQDLPDALADALLEQVDEVNRGWLYR